MLPVNENDELVLEDANTDNTPDMPVMGETWTDREYVYGPDEADEFILQEDREYNTTFFLQDHQGNVVGMTDATGLMVFWRAYDPYGRTMQEVDYGGSTPTRVGFQGLFFDRFNGTVADSAVAPDALGVYYARNRHYSPTLGRWIQRDPNETAMPVIEALAVNGRAFSTTTGTFDLQRNYADGMSPYQFARSVPTRVTDPLGLFDFTLSAQLARGGIQAAVTRIAVGAISSGIASVAADQEGCTLESLLWSMLTGGLTGLVAPWGPVACASVGCVVNGGAALLQGKNGTQIVISSIFGALGGWACGAAANFSQNADDWSELILTMGLAEFDSALIGNSVSRATADQGGPYWKRLKSLFG